MFMIDLNPDTLIKELQKSIHPELIRIELRSPISCFDKTVLRAFIKQPIVSVALSQPVPSFACESEAYCHRCGEKTITSRQSSPLPASLTEISGREYMPIEDVIVVREIGVNFYVIIILGTKSNRVEPKCYAME
ncbi:hypothetical protein Trydic_g5020 [Trypoxylus dichotomus]